jgi:nucleoside-diphosphate-sugar epimerase
MTAGPVERGHWVLIAGGAGFIGSHLCDRLLDAGHRVICVDDLSTGRRANIAHLERRDDFCFVERDVCADGLVDAVAAAIDGDRVSAVLHMASPASPPAYLARPLETLAVGSTGTANLIAVAHAHTARFLLASTSEVYGDPLEHPQTETYWGNVNPIGERSVYDEAKRFAEALTIAHQRANGLDARIVRIFNTYGPRMQPDDGRVVTNLVHQALEGRPLTIYGDGTQTRSFCYVDDETAGILALLDSDVTGPVNIGNPNEFTVLELANTIRTILDVDPGLEHRPLPSDDPKIRQPDITRARTLLGWEPTISLADGLARMIASIRSASN